MSFGNLTYRRLYLYVEVKPEFAMWLVYHISFPFTNLFFILYTVYFPENCAFRFCFFIFSLFFSLKKRHPCFRQKTILPPSAEDFFVFRVSPPRKSFLYRYFFNGVARKFISSINLIMFIYKKKQYISPAFPLFFRFLPSLYFVKNTTEKGLSASITPAEKPFSATILIAIRL